ncbi:MAG: hypothetical protein HYU29_08450 [Chloroflexi bacterium]|nr:hypothetical protein [Chloroflexota bacterium]
MNSRILSTIVVSLSLSLLLFACAKAAPTATPTRAPTVVAVAPTATPTRAPAAAATATPTRAIVAATPTPTAIVAPTATAKRAPSGTLTIAYANLGNEVWLPRNTTQDEAPVMQVLFEGLLGYDPDTATFPSDFLAEKWSVKDTPAGGGLWSFTLRKGVQFHKGWGEITAEDFKFSITEYKKGNSTNASSSAYVEWYGDDPNNIKMLDKYSFEVNSPSRNATLARRISRTALPVMSKKYMDSVGEAGYGKNPVGTGPLDLTEHKRNEKASFKAILNHWRVTPDYAELNLVTVPEISTRIAMLRTGQIDMTAIPSRYKAELLAAGLQIFRAESASEIQQMFGGLFLTTRPKYDPRATPTAST